MAAGVSLHGGRWGWGTGAALFLWATEEAYPWFDGWCCVKGIDPWELSAPRLINLIWFAYVEGKPDEEQELREKIIEIKEYDILNPIEQFKKLHREPSKKQSRPKPRPKQSSSSPEPEDKTTLGRKTDYIPPWWKGERAAYQNAKAAMGGISSLPKMKAP